MLFLLLAGSVVYATDPWGEPHAYPGSMIVMAQVSINGSPAANNDVLGAFVITGDEYQLRGRANVMVIDGIPGCLLQVFCTTNGELIHFKVWDDAAQAQFDAEETIYSEINGSVGSYPDDLYQINGVDSSVIIDPWGSVTALSGQQQLIAQVLNNDVPASANDLLAAIVMVDSIEHLRGKAAIQCIGGMAFSNITIYSESSDENIYFRLWDFDEQVIHNADNILISSPGTTIGSSLEDSYLINFGGAIQQLPRPAINPPGGDISPQTLVSISCEIPAAQIYYTLDGSVPDIGSHLYAAPFSLPEQSSVVVKAKSFWDNPLWLPSLISSATFGATPQVAAPQITPPGGNFSGPQSVSISCATPNAQIRYTTDDSEPGLTSPLYSAPFTVATSRTVKAKAYFADWTPSHTTSATFNFGQFVATPIFTPEAGFYNHPIVLQMFCSTPGAQIRYTLDGTDPNHDSELYAGMMLVSQNTTVSARAYYQNLVPSDLAQAQYSFPSDNQEAYISPKQPGIRNIYPNPSSAKVNFTLQGKSRDQLFELKIYNLRGQCVFAHAGTAKNSFQLEWDRIDIYGKSLNAGVYLAVYTIDGQKHLKRLLLY